MIEVVFQDGGGKKIYCSINYLGKMVKKLEKVRSLPQNEYISIDR